MGASEKTSSKDGQVDPMVALTIEKEYKTGRAEGQNTQKFQVQLSRRVLVVNVYCSTVFKLYFQNPLPQVHQ